MFFCMVTNYQETQIFNCCSFINEFKYLRIGQVKFVEYSLWKTWRSMVCLTLFKMGEGGQKDPPTYQFFLSNF